MTDENTTPGDFYDLTTHEYVGTVEEKDARIAQGHIVVDYFGDFHDMTADTYLDNQHLKYLAEQQGHNVIQLPAYSDANVFFTATREGAGDTWTKAKMEAQGKVFVCAVPKETFLPYSTAPANFWDIQNGQFVTFRTVAQIEELNQLYQTKAEFQRQMESTRDAYEAFVEGSITPDEYAPTKALRETIRQNLRTVQARIDELIGEGQI